MLLGELVTVCVSTSPRLSSREGRAMKNDNFVKMCLLVITLMLCLLTAKQFLNFSDMNVAHAAKSNAYEYGCYADELSGGGVKLGLERMGAQGWRPILMTSINGYICFVWTK